MLEKLLRAPLPEQVVALLEKLEQNPDASHLEKVEVLLGSHGFELTWYEKWCIRRLTRKVRVTLRRERTLNEMMSIVINDKTDEERRRDERAKMYMSMNGGVGSLAQHMHAHTNALAQLNANQQARLAQAYQQMPISGAGWTDPRALYNNGGSQ